MKSNTIQYYKKNVYGVEKMYIKDEKFAQAINGLTGKKTIDQTDMKNLEALGLTFEQVLPN